MKIKEFIEKLSKYNQELELIIEPNLACSDSENYYSNIAFEVMSNNVSPLLLREALCQNGTYEDINGCHHDTILFDEYKQEEKDKKVLVISSPSLRYGEGK